MTIWHLRDLASGEREMIMADDVKFISVPFFDGLRVQSIFKFAQNHPRALKALPVAEEWYKLRRPYLANVIYTTVGEPFQQWLDHQIQKRNQNIG